MSNVWWRAIVFVVLGAIATSIIFSVTTSGRHEATTSPLRQNCVNEAAVALVDLDEAVSDLHQGHDEAVHFEAFRARMGTTLSFCFIDPPLGLLTRRHAYPSPEELQALHKTLDDGWNKSTVGQPWRGATELR